MLGQMLTDCFGSVLHLNNLSTWSFASRLLFSDFFLQRLHCYRRSLRPQFWPVLILQSG
jgi:hypothetical protein